MLALVIIGICLSHFIDDLQSLVSFCQGSSLISDHTEVVFSQSLAGLGMVDIHTCFPSINIFSLCVTSNVVMALMFHFAV